MSTEPNAIASVDAGAASAIVGAGASSIPSGGGAGDSAIDNSALLSDDAILGITEGSGPAITEPVAAPAAAPGTEAQLAIDDFKALFGTNPKVQSLWDKYDNNNKLVTQFGTAADARKAAEIVQMHGGLAQLEEVSGRAAKLDQVDSVFFGGKPEDRKALANEWYDGQGPHELPVTQKAVLDQVNATLGVMQERDPQGYVNVMDKVTREALGREQFDVYLGNLRQALSSGQGMEDAVKQLLGWGARLGLDKGKNAQPNPQADELARRAKELDQRDQTWQESQQNAVVSAADIQFATDAKAEISRSLTELKVNGRPLFGANSSKVRETIEGQIFAALESKLIQNTVYKAQAESLRAKGLIGKQKEMVDLTMRHAKLLLPSVTESIIGEWTKSVVAGAKDTSTRAANGASRVEVGSGSTAGGSTKPRLTIADVKKQGLTPDQILDA